MQIPHLTPDALPSFIHLQPIHLNGLEPVHLGGSPIDLGIALQHTPTDYNPAHPLLRVSPDIILSQQNIDVASKSDHLLYSALQAAGTLAYSPRGAICIYLLLRLGTAAGLAKGERDAWCEYVRFLPRSVPLPTTYNTAELTLLTGTSLESAVFSKVRRLEQEFETLENIFPWATIQDWIYVDTLFRSRSLELPGYGVCMVPVLDFANHSQDANAFFDVNEEGEVTLSLRPGVELKKGEEVTINYAGEEGKSAAEMAFSYGFLPKMDTAGGISLPVKPQMGDPLMRVKLMVWQGARDIRIKEEGDEVSWEAPLVYLVNLNEEDGLQFEVLQTTEGERTIQVLFREKEIEDLGKLEEVLKETEMWEIHQLRAVVMVKEEIEEQLSRIRDDPEMYHDDEGEEDVEGRPQELSVITRLRELEEALLAKAVAKMEKQQEELMSRPSVMAYLAQFQENEEEEESRAVETSEVDADGEIDLS
ncbi:hypothetical protein BZA77DRAFT_336437 [Pyronema omphalodes]|nr:hypothetical protein BZA77DRAFT_336437 [Pyronema omphalodes]